ncbi:right-handed parallel beta-helix repeat-containing protein [uncultured Paenibacillus sp.]|uniref:right-handed parallel beta-helix repeat-containing protein n=1 Tax=uncultured Paenibacillus sp. TaxID=227322 RepID=UPI0015AEC1FC|nr:right-handed parallel beta-helix repeat-containing protein [uncultured Paenibacillus sp.]
MKSMMASLLALVVFLTMSTVLPASAEASGTVYFVDAVEGNDMNAGTSPEAAWQTLDKVNDMTFAPGDSILFKAGSAWSGTLHPKGSGSDGLPIRIDKYGEGPKPILNGDGADAAVYFYSQEYWEVRNLEITNYAAEPGQRRGIHVAGNSGGWTNPKVYRHFVFENLDIHSVRGQVGSSYMHNGGIIVWDPSWNYIVSDVVINNNKIYSLDSVGVYLNGGSFNFASDNKVINNTIYDIAADGAFILNTTDARIEHNVVYDTHKRASGYHVPLWTFETRNAVIQYNEVFNTHPGGDAMAYDSDYRSEGTVIQYNYSHNNAGGAYMVTSDGGDAKNYNRNSVIRYNISQNDLGAIFTVSGNPENTLIYNNTVYIEESLNTRVANFLNWNAWPKNTYFYNNILVNHGTGGYALGGDPNTIFFEHNLFFGHHSPEVLAKDIHKIEADPLFAAPGTARIGRETAAGYQLLQGSPAIGTGRLINNNGGKDFWDHPIPAGHSPNIGAYAGPGLDPSNLPELPERVNLLGNPGFESGDFSQYTNDYNGAAIVHDNVRSGEYAAKLANAVSGIEQQVVGLQPNTLYVLSGFGKRVDGGNAVIGVKNYGGAVKDVHFNTGSDYVKRQLTFITGNDASSAVVYMYKPSVTGAVYFDDLELYEDGEVDPVVVPPQLPPVLPPGKQNLAPLAELSASSYRIDAGGTYSPDKAADGIKNDNTSRWLSAVDAVYPHWLQLEWEQSYDIHAVRVWSGYMNGDSAQIADFEIQYWDSGAQLWKTAATVVGNSRDASKGQFNDLTFQPVTTDKIRMYITKGSSTDTTARLLEIEVWEYDDNTSVNDQSQGEA